MIGTEPLRVAHIAASDISLRYLLLNQLEQMRAAGYDVVGISARGNHAKALEERGLEFHDIPISRRIGPLGDLKALIALYRLLRRERFDIVHTHTPKGALLGQYAALAARVPLRIHTIHGLYFPTFAGPRRRQLFVWLERITLAFSHFNFSQNPEDAALAVAEKVSRPERIQNIGNGIDLTRFDPARFSAADRRATRAALGYDDDTLLVGMVARLVEEKGYLETFEAVKLLVQRVPNARVIFIGGFEDKPDAIKPDALEQYGIAEVAQFLGHREDVDRLYAAMDVFMLPSHREGMPRSVMEAAAMALPCVVTDIRGCRQAVDHEVNGLSIPLKDPQAIAGALERLLRSPDERARMGAASRAKAVREFDEVKIIAELLHAYDRLVHEHGLAPSERRPPILARATRALRRFVGGHVSIS
ncbi:MAG TPA: glycosyltransferase family 4 protein [Kofleriaceae bacterium]|nr:glycosyltransferase family 4 protein [Kofleriaceae bacterium]